MNYNKVEKSQLNKFEQEKAIENKKNIILASKISASIVLAGVFIFFIVTYKSNEPKIYDMAGVFSEFKKIDHWPANDPMQQAEIINTDKKKSAKQTYKVNDKVDEILFFYRKEFKENGWEPEKKFSNGTNWGETFCKDTLMAQLELLPLSARGMEYQISVYTEGKTSINCE